VLTRFFRDRNRTTPIIAVLSDADVVATRSFAAFIEVLRSDTELAERIVIGLPAAGALRLGPVEREVLRTFRDTGARVLLSDFDDLSLRPEVLAATGAKFVRLGAGTLAAAGTDSRLPVHHADLAALFGRAGMEMICTDIESEDQLREMADLDIGLAQGTLLGDWRPVRDDLLTAPPATPMQDNAGTKPAAAAPASATAPAAASAAKGESPKLPLRALLRRA
jgi:EAL domain-containing protein (putative c-di-GMP-specific phosphodiesterase class I)